MEILPSYLQRKSGSQSSEATKKKQKVVKTWDRHIPCLPQTVRNKSKGGNLSYPRGKYCSTLANYGLIWKLHLTSEMTDGDVAYEIRFVFKEPMGHNPNFPSLYLQSTGSGSNSLTIPCQSSSFKWTPFLLCCHWVNVLSLAGFATVSTYSVV